MVTTRTVVAFSQYQITCMNWLTDSRRQHKKEASVKELASITLECHQDGDEAGWTWPSQV